MDLKYLAVLIFNQGVRCDGHFFNVYDSTTPLYTVSFSSSSTT